MSISENDLKKLAQTNPQELIRVLTNHKQDIHTLTFGAEILGEEIKDEVLALPVFKKLLKHINATVREGAIIGLTAFYCNKSLPVDIQKQLKIMANADPSAIIKELSQDLLNEMGDFNETT